MRARRFKSHVEPEEPAPPCQPAPGQPPQTLTGDSIRLVGSVVAEQSDEWAEGRRSLGLEILAKSRIHIVTTSDADIDKEDLPALTA